MKKVHFRNMYPERRILVLLIIAIFSQECKGIIFLQKGYLGTSLKFQVQLTFLNRPLPGKLLLESVLKCILILQISDTECKLEYILIFRKPCQSSLTISKSSQDLEHLGQIFIFYLDAAFVIDFFIISSDVSKHNSVTLHSVLVLKWITVDLLYRLQFSQINH